VSRTKDTYLQDGLREQQSWQCKKRKN